MQSFLERLNDPAPIIYDGGFGTELFTAGIKLANSALANELYPDTVVEVHKSYVDAGVDVIGTNTFVASSLHLAMADKSPDDTDMLVRTACELARRSTEGSDHRVYIAGSIGPSPGAIEEDAGDTDFGIPNRDVREAHLRVGTAMAESGIDLFCLETMFSAIEAAMAVDVLRQFNLPIAVNCTYKYTKNRATGDTVYKTDWGHTPRSLVEYLANGDYSDGVNLLDYIQILGLNCGAEQHRVEHTGMPYACTGTLQLREVLTEMGIEGKSMMAYPNAGIPKLDKQNRTIYDQSPEEMAALIPELLGEGAHIIGGCCGTGPAHIRAFRAAIDTYIAG
jgi:methionine synthase I (cobalamin-dependent)